MKEKVKKEEARRKIDNFFFDLNDKSPKQVKKIKRLTMHHNIKLGGKRKKFCKKCYAMFNSDNIKVRIKNKMKVVKCLKCGKVSRWKIRME